MHFHLARLLVLLALATGGACSAADVVVAKSTSPAGTFSSKPAGDDYYRVQPANAELKAGEMLATLPGASLAAANGAVTLKCIGDYDDRADVPILESAFTLNEPKDADFDLTLDRGRVELTNAKASGKATVNVRLAADVWTIVLEDPGSRVAVDLCGRWPAGTRYRPGATDTAPILLANLYVLHGNADVKISGQTIALKARHHILWDSTAGPRVPSVMANLPVWATEANPNAEAIEAFRALRAVNTNEAIAKFLASDNPVRLRIALVTLGASDDVARLVQCLVEARTREEWEFTTTVLRHWLGRGPGQDLKLLEALQKNGAFTEAQARIVLQLLFGFSTEDLKQPETYEVMIDYLLHDKAAIRALAAWHLARVVPKGKGVPYKLNATPAECEQMAEEWKKLIPRGELPRGM